MKTILCSFALLGLLAPSLLAQDTDTSVARQELELKKKELAVQQAQIEAQTTRQLDLEKQQLEIEKQKLALEQARRDLQVRETSDRLDMQLSGDVLFDTGEATIKPSAKDTLDKVALVLSAFPDKRVTVTGFADSRGGEAANLRLSRDRAEAVKTWLLAKSGVPSDRILAIGEGEDRPAASNSTAEGRQLNRRVEISVAKL